MHVVGSTVDSIVLLAPQAIQCSTAIVIHGSAERRVETDRQTDTAAASVA